jgi:hypothetical protein
VPNESAPVPAGYEAGTRGALEGGEVLQDTYRLETSRA